MKIKNVKMIHVSDWDKLVQKTYGRPYSFQQQDGCKSRGIFNLKVPDLVDDYENEFISEDLDYSEMGVSFAAWLTRDPKQPLKKQEFDFELNIWWERNFYPDIQMIANDLHERELLEAGEYTIDISW
jgi:hypothetical protein